MSSVGADQSIDGSGALPALHRIPPRGRHTQWTEGTHCISSVGPSRSDSLPSTSACVTFISRISVDKTPQVLSPSVSRLLIHHFRLDVHACVHRIVHELSMRERAQSTDEPASHPPRTCGAAPAHGWSGPVEARARAAHDLRQHDRAVRFVWVGAEDGGVRFRFRGTQTPFPACLRSAEAGID